MPRNQNPPVLRTSSFENGGLRFPPFFKGGLGWILNFSYKSLFIILFFLLIGIVTLFKFYPQNKISAAWWNDGWGYRKAVSITNSSSTTTNQYVKITLDTSALITAGKIQNNCNDIRVTNINGKLLTHFIDGDTEYDCNDTDTSIYALVDSIPSNGTTIYIYYGNPSAENIEPVLGSSNYPAISCRNILEHRSDSNGTATYYITPTGNLSDKIQVSCDMSYSSGGWILVWHGLPSEAMVRNTSNESVNLSNDIIFNEMRMEGVNLNFNVISSTVETAKLAKSIPQHYYEVDNTSDATSPKVNFYDLDGNQDVLLSNNYFMYGYGNSWRVFYTCINVSDINYTYLGGYSPTCTPRSSFNTISVSCTGGGNNYCNGNARNTSLKDSGLGLSLYEYQETKVYIRESNITLDVNQSAGSPSTEEQSTAPVAYWKFDEGIGTTAYDSTSNQNNSTVSGATWASDDQCISGKCLNFPSSGSITTLSNARLNFSTNSFTISAWTLLRDYTYPKSTFMISKEVSNCYATGNPGFYIGHGYSSSGSVFCINDGTNYINSTLTYDSGYKPADTQNKWTHFEYIFDRTAGKIKVYVNGIKQSSELDISSVTGSVNNSSNLIIGTLHGWMTDGKIDDVKIYPYARTAAQIKSDYAAGKAHSSSTKGTSANLGSSNQNLSALSDGLVGYWSFNEGSGTTTVDSSGNNNTATLGNGNSAPTWATGKYGIGTSFNGTTNYIKASYDASLKPVSAITMGAWVKLNSTGGWQSVIQYPQQDGSHTSPYFDWAIYVGSGGGLHTRIDGESSGTYGTVSWGEWTHVAITWDGSTTLVRYYINGTLVGTYDGTKTSITYDNNNPVYFGQNAGGAEKISGSVDEVRIYNRALSPSEISQLYNWAPGPIGYWDFNENTGTVANDKSSNNNIASFGSGSSAPTWTSGKFGGGINFNSSSTQFLNLNDNNNFKGGNFSIEAWIKPRSYNPGSGRSIISKSSSSNREFNFRLGDATYNNKLQMWVSTDCSSPASPTATGNTTISLNSWHHVTSTFDGDIVKLYVNGVLDGTADITNGGMCNGGGPLYIGRWAEGGWDFDGTIDQVIYYNYARNPRQIIEDMNAGHPIGGSPVGSQIAYWKFDEGYGSSTYDSSSQSNTGTLMTGTSIPTWSNSGKFNKALNFLGNDSSYVSFPDSGSSSPLDLTSSFTLSSWVKVNSFSSYATIFYKYGSFYLTIDPSGALRFGGNNGTWGTKYTSSTGLITTGNWYHIVLTYDSISTKIIKLYVNGKANISVGVTSDIVPNNNALFIGRGYTGENGSLNGTIDEVKIYNSALTDNDILLDYNQGKSIVMGSKGTKSDGTTNSFSAAREYCIPGDTSTCNPPVGEWKMDEGVGTTAFDTSGNNLHGVLGSGNSSPTWVQGKTGSGLNFDGINDYIQTSSAINLGSSFTLGFWMKPSNLHNYGDPLSSGTGDKYLTFVTYADGHMGYNVGTGTSWGTPINTAAGKFSNNQWYYITGTSNGTNTELFVNGISQNTAPNNISVNQVINIGARLATGYWFTGKIDQVKIYNYARTPAQISWDYNRGKPVAWWKFDECQGTAIGDWSMNGNTGTLNIGASGTQNSVGTCSVGTSAAWTNGASGKQNSSMNFDGTDDTATLSFSINNYTQITYSAWVKINGNPSTTQYSVVTGNYGRSGIYINTTGKARARAWNASDHFVDSTTSVTDNQWHHIVTTYNQGIPLTKIYIDGKYEGQMSYYPDIVTYSTSYIAENPNTTVDTYFKGQIDDVRIFNYALTATQIKDVYNNGAVNFSN